MAIRSQLKFMQTILENTFNLAENSAGPVTLETWLLQEHTIESHLAIDLHFVPDLVIIGTSPNNAKIFHDNSILWKLEIRVPQPDFTAVTYCKRMFI